LVGARAGQLRRRAQLRVDSGEIFVAFATARAETVPDSALDAVFAATVDATEEAVINALWAATAELGRAGRWALALPHDEVLTLLARHGRLVC
jgi:D-aminopeptidase